MESQEGTYQSKYLFHYYHDGFDFVLFFVFFMQWVLFFVFMERDLVLVFMGMSFVRAFVPLVGFKSFSM